MINKFLSLTLIIDLLSAVAAGLGAYLDPAVTSGTNRLDSAIGMAFVAMILAAVPSFLLTAVGVALFAFTSFVTKSLFQSSKKGRSHSKSKPLLRRLIGLFLTEQEEANIVGDLCEEALTCPSRREAIIWLYKQVLKSVLPLLYERTRRSFASYFGKRIR